MQPQRDPNGHKVVSSSGKLFGWNTIHRLETGDKYMTRFWFGRLRLHIFHRGDEDPDPHDHPFDFSTFPFVPYVEEVTVETPNGHCKYIQVVPAWKWTFRPATHTHRVLGALDSYHTDMWDQQIPRVKHGKKIVTLVWRSAVYRQWGFLKNRDGKWCWIGWKEYILGGGKKAPCE